ncbi:MAG: hypothetical protein J1F67_06215 [Muribaculaceae bacterium]|nr:hypothetical protein [Muribaculaceae bacterium]
MRKTFTLAKLAMGLLILGAGVATASAENTLVMGEAYTGLSAANPLEGSFTADANGTLYVAQTGSYDSHLFKSADNYTESNWIVSDGYTQKLNVYTLPYVLSKGQTVYFYGPSGNYDTLTSVEFTWEANEQGLAVITENVPFKAYETVMEYTPAIDGILTIEASTYYQFNWASPAGTGLLFSDLGLNQKVDLQYVGSEQDMDTPPTHYSTPVIGGTTYYFYNSLVSNCEFTFTLAELTGVAIVEVTPTPGMSFDYAGDYGAGVLLSFDPKSVEFDHAYITYTPAGTESEVTEELINVDGQIGENGQYEYTEGYWKFQAVSLYFARAAKGTDLTLTLTNVNYNGIQITESTLDNDAVVVEDGNVSITWVRPAVDMAIVEQSWPTMIYSSSPAGDSSMIATITFNEDVVSKPSASMVFGTQYWGAGSSGDNPDPGMDLPCSVDGATITVDFSGINFGALYNSGSKVYNNITVFIGNIVGADGQKFIDQNPGIAQNISYQNSPAPEGPSSVSTLEKEKESNSIYNLNGVKVDNNINNLSKGVYIINGKKVIVK